MSLYLRKINDNKYYDMVGRRYRRDYDILQEMKLFELRIKINELIEIEKNLTLLEEIENKKNPIYNDFIEALRLKRKLKYGY
jgi:hypothetical protein